MKKEVEPYWSYGTPDLKDTHISVCEKCGIKLPGGYYGGLRFAINHAYQCGTDANMITEREFTILHRERYIKTKPKVYDLLDDSEKFELSAVYYGIGLLQYGFGGYVRHLEKLEAKYSVDYSYSHRTDTD